MTRRAMWPALSGIAVLGVLVAGTLYLRQRARSGQDEGVRASWDPLPRRVEVQVLNGGTIPGEARAVTGRIRAAGLDVVLFGDARDTLRDSTRQVPLVLVRRGDTTGVGRLRELFDTVEVRDAPDARPLVDLTVVVGGGRTEREPRGEQGRSPP